MAGLVQEAAEVEHIAAQDAHSSATNVIESVNDRIRRAVKARGHSPNEQAALKCVLHGHHVARPDRQRTGSLEDGPELIEDAPADAWQRLSCCDGAKGPRVCDWAAARLPANIIFGPDPPTHHRWVMARRSLSDPGEIAYYLAYAPADVEITGLVRIAGSRWAIEACFQAARQAAMSRSWPGRSM